MPHYLNHNGKFITEGKAIITAGNRSFRYGDGLFETMKVSGGKIRLADYHFERLFSGIKLLQFEQPAYFSPEFLSGQVLELCRKNHHTKNARARLMVFRGTGGLYDPENHFPNYIIQSWELPPENSTWNENGLVINIYPEARKAIDTFSNLKSNNYLPYFMAALYAKQHKLNDCLILNTNENICDATIANIFIIKDKLVSSPPLSEGCVAGVMRRYLLENLPAAGYQTAEVPITTDDIRNADEVFLSNAIYGIHWVAEFDDIQFKPVASIQIDQFLLKSLQ